MFRFHWNLDPWNHVDMHSVSALGSLFYIVGSFCRHLAKELKLDGAGGSTGPKTKPRTKGSQGKGKAKPSKGSERTKKGKSKKGKGTPPKKSKKVDQVSSPAAETAAVPKKAKRARTKA